MEDSRILGSSHANCHVPSPKLTRNFKRAPTKTTSSFRNGFYGFPCWLWGGYGFKVQGSRAYGLGFRVGLHVVGLQFWIHGLYSSAICLPVMR